uniref:DDE-1 domain-containing protein n=1 Tax=Ditylenchus dipsaci TaxID=166011 RepID=A0A915DJ36_9BILA
MKTHNFASRRGTTVCQKAPLVYSSKIVQFIRCVAKIREKHRYDNIYACDETAVWLNASGEKTVEERGLRKVSFLTTTTLGSLLTNATDRSKDDFVHYFKANRPIPEGLEMLKEKRGIETAAKMSEEEDFEEGLANGHLSAQAKVVQNQAFFVI